MKCKEAGIRQPALISLDSTDAFGYSGITVFKHSAVPGQIKFFDPGHFVLAEEITAT